MPALNFRGGCLLQIFGGGACSKFSGGVPAPNFRGGCLLQIFGGCLLQIFGGGACSKFSGGCLLQIFGGGVQFSEYGQRSAGTHPTGMHSCLLIFLFNLKVLLRV